MKLQRFAVVTASLTFLLLLMGGLVHNTRSSLACPDWPLCYGSAFPHMVGGVAIEHSHRLVATTVGILTTILMVLLWRRGSRTGDTRLKVLGVAAFLCVVAQGVLGGITVLYRLPPLVSTGHLATSMIFFSLLIYIAFRLRPPAQRRPLAGKVQRMALSAAILVYAQMVLGALMRHLGAGLACVELPLCHGQIWPTGAGVTPYLLVHVSHRLLALLVLGHVTAASVIAFRNAEGNRAMRRLAVAAPLLVLVQITLGVLSITTFLGVVPVTAHLGCAALLLATVWSMYLVSRGELAARSQAAVVTEPAAIDHEQLAKGVA